ncbi:MAG: hypothetical protein HKM24_02585, partial [Gammaproteobacteria bacterium]|nr:hypothetical protein [Gammaproteobacteria bacterium]
AKRVGFNNFNIDLMYGLPHQSTEQAMNDIDKAISLSPSHISHYQLTIEPNTQFHAKPPTLPNDDQISEMQTTCQQRLDESGFVHYEVSAFAHDQETCRHNLNYWRFGDYLGVGAGAHGKLTTLNNEGGNQGKMVTRFQNWRHPTRYLLALENHDQAIEQQHVSCADDLIFEYMLNVSRLRDEISAVDFEDKTGVDRQRLTEKIQPAITRRLIHSVTQDHWRLTKLGWQFLNDLQAIFLPKTGSVTHRKTD